MGRGTTERTSVARESGVAGHRAVRDILGASKAAIQSAGLDVEFEPSTANAESLARVSEGGLSWVWISG